MLEPRRLASRALATTLTAAATVAVGAAVAVAVSTPSQAATCNGYVGITFDDGPTPGNTTNLLNALRSAGIRATMFNQGNNASANPSLVQAEQAANMWIGNHSWSHPHLVQGSQANMQTELGNTQNTIRQITGTAPVLFRPPYGETNGTLKSVEASLGLTEIIWDVDSQDWNGASVSSIVAANARLTNGQVILMHDWPANTVQAIPQIAAGLASRNLCAGMISPQTGRAVAPTGGTVPPPQSSPPRSSSNPPPQSSNPQQGGSGCRVTSQVQAWNTGLTNNVTITNTGSSAISNWTLTMTLPSGQTITSGWGASYSPTSGNVNATPASYTATIAPGGSVAIGYQANHNGNNGAPTNISLNGTRCS